MGDITFPTRDALNGMRDAVLAGMQREVHLVNVDNGWFDEGRTFGDDIALLHSEVSEALEEFRDRGLDRYAGIKNDDGSKVDIPLGDGDPYPEGAKPLGVPSEAADIFIRLLDFCHRHDVNLAAEYEAKLAYNRTRGYKHGGKAL